MQRPTKQDAVLMRTGVAHRGQQPLERAPRSTLRAVDENPVGLGAGDEDSVAVRRPRRAGDERSGQYRGSGAADNGRTVGEQVGNEKRGRADGEEEEAGGGGEEGGGGGGEGDGAPGVGGEVIEGEEAVGELGVGEDEEGGGGGGMVVGGGEEREEGWGEEKGVEALAGGAEGEEGLEREEGEDPVEEVVGHLAPDRRIH